MTETTLPLPGLSPVNGKALTARFDGGALSSDAGLLALREVERRLDVCLRVGHAASSRCQAVWWAAGVSAGAGATNQAA